MPVENCWNIFITFIAVAVIAVVGERRGKECSRLKA